ncbi:MAG: entericidin EcnAB [Campylobacteraceae bacterium]|nr:entericidin EcnAB [Campylobacteraceae bacterium]
MRAFLLGLGVLFIFSGCATWKGVKKDSSDAWDATKKGTKKAYKATKEAINEATED